MAGLVPKGLLQIRPVAVQQVRTARNRINIQRPAPLHLEKLKFLKVAQVIPPPDLRTPAEKCLRPKELSVFKTQELSPLDKIYAAELINWFRHSQLIAIYARNPADYEDVFKARVLFFKANMKMLERKKPIVQEALAGTEYENLLRLFRVHTMMVCCPEPKVSELIKINRRLQHLTLLAVVVENRILNVDEAEAYSKLPDLQMARAQLVQVLQSGAQDIIRDLQAHQNTLVQHLESRIEQLKERAPSSGASQVNTEVKQDGKFESTPEPTTGNTAVEVAAKQETLSEGGVEGTPETKTGAKPEAKVETKGETEVEAVKPTKSLPESEPDNTQGKNDK